MLDSPPFRYAICIDGVAVKAASSDRGTPCRLMDSCHPSGKYGVRLGSRSGASGGWAPFGSSGHSNVTDTAFPGVSSGCK